MPRGVSNSSPVALSRYRQLRVTVTQEANGNCSFSVYGKRLNADWRQTDCLVRGVYMTPPRPLLSTEDVVALMVDLLREEMLPGIG